MTTLFPTPDAATREAMHKAWSRNDLERYLARWAHATVPQLPAGFLAFAHRTCDVGCGFGRFLIEESAKHPDRGYLGIDKGSLRGGKMLTRFEAIGHANLFGIHTNAIPFLAAMPNAVLDVLTLFYPNPWWPSKHRRKRWSYHPLLPKLIALLKPGGTILLTSNEGFYLSEWTYALSHHPEIAGRLTPTYSGEIRARVGRTHFEAKFMAEGTPCGEVVFQKSSGKPLD